MKVAVLIPAYNAAPFLAECLDSVLAAGSCLAESGDHELEIFCRDDGSSDATADILREYSRRHVNIHFTVQENAGVVAARNRLLDELPEHVEAFAFVDADDFVAPEIYATLVEAMIRTKADIAECGMDGNAVAEELLVEDMTRYLLRRTAIGPWINVVNKLYRRVAAGAVRFRAGLCFEEDFFFNYEVNAAVRRKVLVPGVYYSYRDNPSSATHVLNLRRYYESAARRIRLSLEVFFLSGRIPDGMKSAWAGELCKDAFRMCVRKNLKKNRNPALRRELFAQAGGLLAEVERTLGGRPTGLNPVQLLIWRACRRGSYRWAALLVGLT